MLKILHIDTGADPAELDLNSFADQDVTVESCNSILEGIIAFRQQEYDAIVFNETSESPNGLDVLNTLRQNDIRAPLLYNNQTRSEVQVFEQSNRRRFDLEKDSPGQTLNNFLSNLQTAESRHISQLSHANLQEIVDKTAMPVLVLNQYASIIYANKMACDFLRFAAPIELFNNSLNRIFPLKSALSGRKDIPSLISERSAREQSFFWEIVDRNGDRKCVSVRANRISEHGPVTTMLQFLIGNEKGSDSQGETPPSEDIVRVICDSKMLRSGLEMALNNAEYFFDFEEKPTDQFTEETFAGSTQAIFACSMFNDDQYNKLETMLASTGNRPTLVVALASKPEAIQKAAERGVRGFVLGEDEFDQISDALAVLRAGGFWLSEEVAESFFSNTARHSHPEQKINSEVLDQLTRREKQVLSMLAKGMKNHDIADNLKLSYRTVVTHVYNIYRKLNLSSRTEAIHLAIASGLVSVTE